MEVEEGDLVEKFNSDQKLVHDSVLFGGVGDLRSKACFKVKVLVLGKLSKISLKL